MNVNVAESTTRRGWNGDTNRVLEFYTAESTWWILAVPGVLIAIIQMSNAHNATLPSRWIALFQAAMEALFWELYCFRISLFLFWMPMDCFVALWTPLFFEWFHQGFTGG